MKRTNYLFTLYCLFFSISLFSQTDYYNGYIIKSNKDTVYGLIKLGSGIQNAHECNFKKDSVSEPIKYLPSDILGYRYINGKYYISKTISYRLNSQKIYNLNQVEFNRDMGTYNLDDQLNNNSSDTSRLVTKQAFLEFLIKGNVDFYIYYNNTPYYFAKKGQDSLMHLENTTGIIYNQWNDDYSIEKKEYIGLLNYILQDCKGIQSRISNTKLNNESLIKLAKYYHNQTCDDPEEKCIVYEKTDRQLYFSVIPTINYSRLNIKPTRLSNAYNYDFTNSNTYSFGLNLKLSNFQYVNYHFTAQVGFLYQNQYFEPEDQSVAIEFEVVEIPLEINYSFLLHSKVNPFIGLAINPCYRLAKNVASETHYNLELVQISNHYLSYSGIIGLDYHIGEKIFLTYAIQFKAGGAFYNSANLKDDSKSNELIFRLGLGYVINK